MRRDNGKTYEDFLKELARYARIEEPVQDDLASLSRKR